MLMTWISLVWWLILAVIGAWTMAGWATNLLVWETQAEREALNQAVAASKREEAERLLQEAHERHLSEALADANEASAAWQEINAVCVDALQRALDALKRGDHKLVEREVDYVLEEIERTAA
jgi:cytoskeletal protein RodZ